MQVHPSQISPAQTFDLFYFIRNPLDGATYYVRAVIYDLRTGDILATQNLTQSANKARLFTATLQAPADSTGNGRSIVSVASVYTDSSYATISQNYEEQEQYFLVKEDRTFGGGGTDWKAVRRMIDDALGARLDALPQPVPTDFSQVTGAIGALQREINRIPKEIDLTDVSAHLAQLETLVRAIPADQDEPSDLEPVTAGLQDIATLIDHVQQQIAAGDAAILETLNERLAALAADITTKCEAAMKDLMGRQELTIPLSKLVQDKPPAAPALPDVAHLMS